MNRLAFLLLGAVLALAVPLAGPAVVSPAGAVEPDEILDDPALERRAREISAGIRCVVCQNESIDSSSASLAKDMRVLIRERLKAGDSNAEVEAYLVERYGDYVLLDPPMKPATYLLWFGPGIVLLLGGIGVAFYLRGRGRQAAAAQAGGAAAAVAPLSAEEQRRLQSLLTDDDDDEGSAGSRSGGAASQ